MAGVAAQNRITELDGLRGVAILMVVVFHYVANPVVAEPGTFLAYVQLVGYLGWSGVDLFFVLSGYLIASILIRNQRAERYFSTFYVRRVCRILPAYLLIVAALILLRWAQPEKLAPLYAGATSSLYYLLFIQNYFVNEMGGYGPVLPSVTWSLAVEEQFYLVIPFLIRYVAGWKLAVLSAGLVLFAPLARFLTDGLGSVTYAYCRTDGIFIGVLIAYLHTHHAPGLLTHRRWLTGLLAIALACTVWMGLHWPDNGGVWVHSLLSVFYGLLLLHILLSERSPVLPALRWQWLLWLGRRSYGIYLYHLPTAFLFFLVLDRPHINRQLSDLIYPFAALLICCLIAEVSYRVIERPVIRFGRRKSYSPVSY